MQLYVAYEVYEKYDNHIEYTVKLMYSNLFLLNY